MCDIIIVIKEKYETRLYAMSTMLRAEENVQDKWWLLGC